MSSRCPSPITSAGDLLARIDDRDYRIAVDKAQAQVAVAQANTDAQVENQQAQIDQVKAQLKQAKLQFAQEEAGTCWRSRSEGHRHGSTWTKSDLEAQQANTSRAKAAPQAN